MSPSLEELLDATLDTRRQRRLQHLAELAHAQQAINDAQVKIECEQTYFHTDVRSHIQQAIDRANRHLAKRPEHCEFHDVSGHYTGPQHPGGSLCNPIAYELRADGAAVGERLLVELTPHGCFIQATLCHPTVSIHGDRAPRIDFGWRSVPLDMFSAVTAENLLVQYMSAIATRWPLGQRHPSDRPAAVAADHHA